ncbi:hypothetical protein HPP92_008628 [Vanilla planifolia]|uniref:Late embryogenesis abundant protein LEA-2 subgroup domain-containing protein n=1 Tax=Vanilla planifolia TaxID=51239 RepID=A0A835V5Q8_VANPL|nr:hypothetical protein HPP92_008814 [Vanilla planifolia]KAG0486533.1 hypothetical protein HPP92_008628 [Vanilla planifolia]
MDQFDKHCKLPQCKPNDRRGVSGTIIASCALAAGFIILAAVGLTVTLFVLFRPREPEINISAFQLPHFSFVNGTASFYFAEYAAVRNPNHAAFSHYGSSLQVLYGGGQVGFMYIPAGEVTGGQTLYMSASFPVESFRVLEDAPNGILELESSMIVKGRVRVLMYFTHHIEVDALCRIGVSGANGSVVGFRC